MATTSLQESGFLVNPFNLMTTELNTLANATSVTSSVGGTSGVFTQTNTGSGLWGIVHFKAGGAFTPTQGGYLAGWFLYSPDGSAFEKVASNTDVPRAPDFIIPFIAAAHATNDVVQCSGLVRLPWWSFKVYVMSRVGASLAASGNVLQLGSVAVQSQ